MPYTVQFVGLVCFFREQGGRRALLPDGRKPDGGIDPHYGSIVVAPGSIQKIEGWAGVEGVDTGTFPLDEPCEIVIQGADTPGTLDTSSHDGHLPQLRQINANFEIDPARAQTIAKLRIRQGRLTVRSVPGGTALISQLDVPHDGPIDIVIRPDDGSPERKIMLAPETEIAVANMAHGNLYREAALPGSRRKALTPRRGPKNGKGSHFKIYEKLSVNKDVSLTDQPDVTPAPESDSRHVLFSSRRAITLYTDCSNTGCC